MNPYETLAVDRTATADEIKKAYRRACVKNHPDKGGDPEKFLEIQRAFDILSDPERRSLFDRTGDTGEETGIGQIEAMIAGEVVSILRAAIASSCAPPDLLLALRRQFRAQYVAAEKAESRCKLAVRELGKIAETVTRKSAGRNIFREVTIEQIKDIEREAEQCRQQSKAMDAALEYLEQYRSEEEFTGTGSGFEFRFANPGNRGGNRKGGE